PANAIVMPGTPAREAASPSVPDMSLNARTSSLAGMAACAGRGVALAVAMPVVGQPPPQQVTSDTPEYCMQLLNRISELARMAPLPPPTEVASLSMEGQRMCRQGQTRGGLLRLRRALALLLQKGDEEPEMR